VAEDVVGVIQYEFVDWRERKPAGEILDDFRRELTGFPGVDIEVLVPEGGPPTGKAIQIQLSAVDPAGLTDVARAGCGATRADPGVIDISDGLPPPGVDWEIKVDRSVAARYGIGPSSVGTVVQLVTTGLKLTDYRPAGVTMPSISGCGCPRTGARCPRSTISGSKPAQGFGPDLEFRHPRACRKRWNADQDRRGADDHRVCRDQPKASRPIRCVRASSQSWRRPISMPCRNPLEAGG
jgi:hypothetical protein